MLPQQKHNFGAGPCILPQSVLQQAANAVTNWNGMGLSILEVSHRSPEFESVMLKTQLLVKELLNVPDYYSILFMQGGASTQFSTLAMSFLQGQGKRKAAYLDSGYFAQKAIAEARKFGEVQIVASSRERNYTYIPDNYTVHHDVAYLHCTSNNTIEGTEMHSFPQAGVPLICDMSSDIFSRPINITDFDLIYAGAQKNMGPAGMTLVIVKNDLLETVQHTLPAMADYTIFRENNSMYNTPPVFSIYVAMLNMIWLKEQGGVAAIAKLNKEKADLLYAAIDKSEIFYGIADKEDRSLMNVTFKCHDPKHETAFIKYASDRGIVGIKGYRTVGGFRASLYNALPLFSVEYLVKTILYFEKQQDLKARSRVEQLSV